MKKWVALLLVLIFALNFAACAKEADAEKMTPEKLIDALREHDYKQVSQNDEYAAYLIDNYNIASSQFYTSVEGGKTGDGWHEMAWIYYFEFANEKDANKALNTIKKAAMNDGCFLASEKGSNGKKFTGTIYDSYSITSCILSQVGNTIIFAVEAWEFSVTSDTYDYELEKIIQELGY